MVIALKPVFFLYNFTFNEIKKCFFSNTHNKNFYWTFSFKLSFKWWKIKKIEVYVFEKNGVKVWIRLSDL